MDSLNNRDRQTDKSRGTRTVGPPVSAEGQNGSYFIKRNLNNLWRFVNKRVSLRKRVQWLHKRYKMQPSLFAHWSVCPAY